jgi:hypothetical protein
MRRLTTALSAAMVAASATSTGAGAAAAATLCVGTQTGCFAAIQPAVDAAHDGDTIAVGAGTFAAGITVEKSVRIQAPAPRGRSSRAAARC